MMENGTRIFLAELINASIYNKTISEVPTGISAERIYSIAQRQGMIYLLLNPLLAANNVPEEIKNRIRKVIVWDTLTSKVQMHAIDTLGELFEKNGIRHQMLKGAVLKKIYPKPEMRGMSDIDILIDPKQLSEIDYLLKKSGYISQGFIDHHDIYDKSPFLSLEMHRFLSEDKSMNFSRDYFDSEECKASGCEYTYEFSLENYYTYMITHMARHFYKRGCGVRGLVDIYVFLSKYSEKMDWEYTISQLEKLNITDFEYYMKRLAYSWINGNNLNEFETHLFDYMIDGGVYGKEENGIWSQYAKENIKSDNESNFKTKLQLRMWYIFPPYSYMEHYYSWLKNKPILLPWAWIYRALKRNSTGRSRNSLTQEVDSATIRNMQEIYKKMNLKFD